MYPHAPSDCTSAAVDEKILYTCEDLLGKHSIFSVNLGESITKVNCFGIRSFISIRKKIS